MLFMSTYSNTSTCNKAIMKTYRLCFVIFNVPFIHYHDGYLLAEAFFNTTSRENTPAVHLLLVLTIFVTDLLLHPSKP